MRKCFISRLRDIDGTPDVADMGGALGALLVLLEGDCSVGTSVLGVLGALVMTMIASDGVVAPIGVLLPSDGRPINL
jgi:hypothetical protein